MPDPIASNAHLVGEGLSCRRGGQLVFAGIDLCLPAGGALVLAGSNGSGKSSLLRMLASLLAPIEGRLLWAGQPVATDPARYRVAIDYAGHLDAIKPALTPLETLSFWAALRGATNPAPAIDAALDRFGLGGVADWPCRFLSAGQRRRLGLARLVASPSPVWLLDEPTATLDDDSEIRLMVTIAEHRAAGGRLAVATHQPLALPDAATIRLDDYAVARRDALDALW